MKKMLQKLSLIKNTVYIIFYISLFTFSVQAQLVSGRVTASRSPVKNASVTFIDNADTLIKYTAVTDETGNYEIDIITGVESDGTLPTSIELIQNYPNPFSSSTAIPYRIKKQSDIQVTIYDILGREVRRFSAGVQDAGIHRVMWDGKNDLGHQVANGVYLYKLKADNKSLVKKMILNSGSSGFVPLSLNKSTFSSKKNPLKINSIKAGNYTIRVENTNITTPLLVPVELENVTIQNDTTINFSVEYRPVADINFDSLHQIIRGFGAANIVGWRPDMTDSEIELAFGTGEGQLGFTILRLRIPPDSNQWNINVPTAKKAYDMGALLMASPWSPPASMKTNNNLVGGELREDAYDDFADHLDEFAKYMYDNGAPVYAVSVQNEPDIEVGYESCDYSPAQMLKFMRENAPAVGTRVTAPESFQYRREMSDPILNDSLACANTDFISGHIYGGGLASYPLAEAKGKEIWMTEHLTASSSSANDWNLAFDVAVEMNNVMKAGMSAYIWWYIVRYYGPISDGETSGDRKGEATKKGYVMSQFSRFIRPGFYRVESQAAPALSSVDVTAYKDPSSSKIVIVAVNSDNNPVENVFRIGSNLNTSLTPYTTSENKNCEQGTEFNVADNNFSFTLEPLSITTFVSN